MRIGYVRVSSLDQNPDRQIEDLKAQQVEKIFMDKISGKNTDRPELQKMLSFIREGDTLIVHSLVASEAEDQRISKFIEDYKKNNPKVGEVLSQLWFEVKFKPEEFRDKDAFAVIEERVDELIAKEIQDFSAKWGVNPEALKMYASTVLASEISSKTVDASMGDYAAYKAAGGSVTKLKYLRELREAVATFVKDEIKPLTKR